MAEPTFYLVSNDGCENRLCKLIGETSLQTNIIYNILAFEMNRTGILNDTTNHLSDFRQIIKQSTSFSSTGNSSFLV